MSDSFISDLENMMNKNTKYKSAAMGAFAGAVFATRIRGVTILLPGGGWLSLLTTPVCVGVGALIGFTITGVLDDVVRVEPALA